jgi:hypothetical protein
MRPSLIKTDADNNTSWNIIFTIESLFVLPCAVTTTGWRWVVCKPLERKPTVEEEEWFEIQI